MADNIKVYKLLSGAEIIARVIEEGIGWVVLEEIRTFRMHQNAKGDGYNLELVHFSPTLPTHKWKYFTSSFLGEAVEVPDGLQKAYIQEISNIEIVSSI